MKQLTKQERLTELKILLDLETTTSDTISHILTELIESSYCQKNHGFRDAEELPDCGECYHCRIEQLLSHRGY